MSHYILCPTIFMSHLYILCHAFLFYVTLFYFMSQIFMSRFYFMSHLFILCHTFLFYVTYKNKQLDPMMKFDHMTGYNE